MRDFERCGLTWPGWLGFKAGVMQLPDLSHLTHQEKDTLILALWTQVQALTVQVQTLVARAAELEAKLDGPPKTPDNSSLPPSKSQKPNRPEKRKRRGPRLGSLGRGRALAATPDEIFSTKPVRYVHCQVAHLARLTMFCTVATTRSTCPRSRLW